MMDADDLKVWFPIKRGCCAAPSAIKAVDGVAMPVRAGRRSASSANPARARRRSGSPCCG
jgi:ABC-type microcin C transport system duplicated ATPase subunit YejF